MSFDDEGWTTLLIVVPMSYGIVAIKVALFVHVVIKISGSFA